MRTKKLKTGPLAVALLCLAAAILIVASRAQADTVVYKETCGEGGHASWNLVCKVEKNTLADRGFGRIKSVTVCGSFDNRGNFNSPATIVHDGTESQDKPTDLFDTVRYKGDESAGILTWSGTGSRRGPGWTMKGELRLANPGKSLDAVYSETLSDGRRPLGEIKARCTRMPDE